MSMKERMQRRNLTPLSMPKWSVSVQVSENKYSWLTKEDKNSHYTNYKFFVAG